MAVKGLIEEMVDKFHKKVDSDPAVKKRVEPIYKRVNIDLGTEKYSFVLKNATISDINESLLDDFDVEIKTDEATLTKLVEGTMRPFRAYLTKKVIINGKIEDLLQLKDLF